MSYSLINKAERCSCNRVVPSVYLPSNWANFFFNPKTSQKPQTSSGVCITTGEQRDKHRSVRLNISSFHSFALAATHMSADLITSPLEINGPRHIWGPICLSYHSSVCWLWLFGPCHQHSVWARRVIDQALLTDRWSMTVGVAMDLSFSFLYSFLLLPFDRLRYRGVMYVMFPWGVPNDWHKPPGRQADWLAGRSSPTWGFDTDGTHSHIYLSNTPHTSFCLFS